MSKTETKRKFARKKGKEKNDRRWREIERKRFEYFYI